MPDKVKEYSDRDNLKNLCCATIWYLWSKRGRKSSLLNEVCNLELTQDIPSDSEAGFCRKASNVGGFGEMLFQNAGFIRHITFDGGVVDFIIGMHRAGPAAAGHYRKCFHHEARYQCQFRLLAQSVRRHQFLCSDQHAFCCAGQRVIPERRAVDARIAQFVDFSGMNHGDIRPDCGDHVDIGSRTIGVAHGLPLIDARQFAAVYAGHRLEGNSEGGCTQPRD